MLQRLSGRAFSEAMQAAASGASYDQPLVVRQVIQVAMAERQNSILIAIELTAVRRGDIPQNGRAGCPRGLPGLLG